MKIDEIHIHITTNTEPDDKLYTGIQLSHQTKFSDDLLASLFLCHIYHMYSIYTCMQVLTFSLHMYTIIIIELFDCLCLNTYDLDNVSGKVRGEEMCFNR